MGSESSRNANDKEGVSRIPAFYKMSVRERVRAVHERGLLTEEDYRSLTSGEHVLKVGTADKMIENVIGIMGLPVGLALNFLINGRDFVIPLVVEEPSIVAALSSAAKTARLGGGFKARATDPILIGQVQIVDVDNAQRARETLLEHRDDILNLANSLHPKMVARGGGAKDLEVHIHGGGNTPVMVVLHLLVDTRDAMGANLVNTMCEGVASLVENLTEGKVFLRILSNLTDRALAYAEVTIPVANLEGKGHSGEQVRDGIILANDFALVDPYRAATHNKGIMNGIDAAAIASGNDWRAIEAAAHAYAARDGQYRALTQWSCNDVGDLVGSIEIPMKVGTVGGPLESNPTVALNHRLLGVESATELAGIMASVGLAQNFGALRALVTDGIQQGHMTLHARSVATAAGASAEIFETVVEQLIESGEIKVWRAQQIIGDLESPVSIVGQHAAEDSPRQVAHGKIILLGEHAVVYGRHAIAAPIPLAVEARVVDARDGVLLMIPRWGIEQRIRPLDQNPQGFDRTLDLILETLALSGRSMRIEVFPKVPRAMGLGGSAAVAVSIIRAIDAHFELKLTDEDVNALAFECEKVAHGTPSGIDNTVATYGRFMLYRPGDSAEMTPLTPARPLPMVVGMTGKESLTAKTVAHVRTAWKRSKSRYERLFDEIDDLTLHAVEAVKTGDLEELGDLMNLCQGILNGLQVSNAMLEELIQIARSNGAVGAKLTGGGGGGSMIALCPDGTERVRQALEDAGYQAMEVELG